MAILRDASKLKPLIALFPRVKEISYCFAYGSAVFEQALTAGQVQPNSPQSPPPTGPTSAHSVPDRKMIDLILAVDNPLEWHRENLLRNTSHYSSLRVLGPRWISKIQQHFGAKIFYNTLIPIGDDYIKYGVISTKDLINDLLDWDTFYVSGRLHKPTLTLHRNAENAELNNALKMNIQSALHVALLLQSEKFTEEDLFMTIAGLSYSGDFRMTFGEDPNKVAKIVRPQMAAFRQLYNPLLASDLLRDLVMWSSKNSCYVQNCSSTAIQWHLNLLPKKVQYYLSKEWLAANTASNRLRDSAAQLDMDDLMRRLAFDITYRSYLKRSIESIVFSSSWTQSIKGLFTAGLSKSITYSMEKINKMLKGSTQVIQKGK